MQLLGGLFAPDGREEWKKLGDTVKFIEFEYVTGLYIRGFGVINGRGKGWWDIACRDHPQLQVYHILYFIFFLSSKHNLG